MRRAKIRNRFFFMIAKVPNLEEAKRPPVWWPFLSIYHTRSVRKVPKGGSETGKVQILQLRSSKWLCLTVYVVLAGEYKIWLQLPPRKIAKINVKEYTIVIDMAYFFSISNA